MSERAVLFERRAVGGGVAQTALGDRADESAAVFGLAVEMPDDRVAGLVAGLADVRLQSQDHEKGQRRARQTYRGAVDRRLVIVPEAAGIELPHTGSTPIPRESSKARRPATGARKAARRRNDAAPLGLLFPGRYRWLDRFDLTAAAIRAGTMQRPIKARAQSGSHGAKVKAHHSASAADGKSNVPN
jgi:hypothetical protein